jgi:hypothetical protein
MEIYPRKGKDLRSSPVKDSPYTQNLRECQKLLINEDK